jgi:hypothetical protein
MRTLLIAITLLVLMVFPVLACALIPPLAVLLDELLPQATLPETDLATVKDLRAQIQKLVAAGKKEKARETEEQAMLLLGYRKTWLKCGPGTFLWTELKRPS